MAAPLKLDLIVDDKGSLVLSKFGSNAERAAHKVTDSFQKMGQTIALVTGGYGIARLAESFLKVGIAAD